MHIGICGDKAIVYGQTTLEIFHLKQEHTSMYRSWLGIGEREALCVAMYVQESNTSLPVSESFHIVNAMLYLLSLQL